ncbi:MAG: YjhG/YagF family D-xylonate dehydratase [Anaerolineae bacterium]
MPQDTVKDPISIEAESPSAYAVVTQAAGPSGSLPLDPDYLRTVSSGELFGLTEDAGMGWPADELRRSEFLILSNLGGLRGPTGSPIALGYHTGHWELGLLTQAAAERFRELEAIPFAGYVSDPCDGRTQGTPGMMDSLPYRNDAAVVFRRLIRSLPARRGVLGIASCDKGLPALMMALAAQRDLACVLVPGGVTLPPTEGEDAGKVQTLSVRFARGELGLREAARLGCRACASPGGGCQFLGTAGTGQVVGEALGLTLTHAALAPSGQEVWLDLARRSAQALVKLAQAGIATADLVTEDAVHNAMVVYAAFGGSTNLLLHLPAIAHAAGLARPTVAEWDQVNRAVPRLVDVLPNGPVGHPTVRVFLAGGVPEVMLHLRELGLLRLDALTAHGRPLGEQLDRWETSERRRRLRDRLFTEDGVDPDTVIMSPQAARARGITSTLTFPRGNLAPEGAVIKSTALDPSLLDDQGVFRMTGPARVFTREDEAIAAVKGQTADPVRPGDVMILIGRGPLGCGMEETYQITSALKHLSWGKEVALITDARFSGVSTGACIGHVGPEALAGGPLGRVRDGDTIRILVDCVNLRGEVDLVGHGGRLYTPAEGATVLAARTPHPALTADPALPEDTRLWAALQQLGGGTWGGCVYDVEAIVERLADTGRPDKTEPSGES